MPERDEDLVPEHTPPPCGHLADAPADAVARTPGRVRGVSAAGLEWVHLRLCLSCGHVGCCDSSIGKHATGHYHETDHPVMRSFELGEAWRWCYVDDVIG